MKLTFKKNIAREILLLFSFTLFTLFSLFLLPYCIELVDSVIFYNKIVYTETELLKSEIKSDSLYGELKLWRSRIIIIKDILIKELDKIPKSRISSDDYLWKKHEISNESTDYFRQIVHEWVELKN